MANKITKKRKTKPSRQAPRPEAKSAKPATPSRGKKLGERVEVIRRRLALGEIEAERMKACDLMRQKNDLEEKKKASGSEWTARIAETKSKMNAALSAAASGQVDEEITIEEWLTPQNQVLRYRADTGELIGDRQARQEDLQEDLPLGDTEVDEEDEEDEEDETAPTPPAEPSGENFGD